LLLRRFLDSKVFQFLQSEVAQALELGDNGVLNAPVASLQSFLLREQYLGKRSTYQAQKERLQELFNQINSILVKKQQEQN